MLLEGLGLQVSVERFGFLRCRKKCRSLDSMDKRLGSGKIREFSFGTLGFVPLGFGSLNHGI